MNDQCHIVDKEKSPVPLEDKRELITAVYHGVWKEFYSWEEQDCTTSIASLARPLSRNPGDLDSPPFDSHDSIDLDIDSEHSASSFLVSEYDETGTEIASSRVSCAIIPFKSSLEPHPPYQISVPISRNISWRNGDPDDQLSVPFIPYPDEGFKIITYFEQFPDGCPPLEWQHMRDPDHEMIHLEAIRRLAFVHKLSFLDIDREEIFPYPAYRGNESGIVWNCSQRDKLTWPGSSLAPYPELKESDVPEKWDIQRRLASILRTFCPNLSCVQSLCSVHVGKNPDLELSEPTIQNSALRLTIGEVCNRDCFRHIHDDVVDQLPWDPEDHVSRAILNLFPDMTPCDLAVLCRKPCREVFVLRYHLFPDHQTDAAGSEGGQEEQPSLDRDFFMDKDPDKFTPLTTVCNHKGPCTESVCECYDNRVRCRRACLCDPSHCALRWKGCKCSRKSHSNTGLQTTCGQKCPCRLARRECDIELCLSCGARDAIAGSNRKCCSNTVIQRGKPALLEIKRGIVGLGAFATHVILPGDYVGEYVGEFYNEDNAEEPRDFIRTFKHLNYLFKVNQTQSLDADRVGNETRYLNHKEDPNTEVRVIFVNGEHRLGFFATKRISKGRELFVHYGDKYWIGGVQPQHF